MVERIHTAVEIETRMPGAVCTVVVLEWTDNPHLLTVLRRLTSIATESQRRRNALVLIEPLPGHARRSLGFEVDHPVVLRDACRETLWDRMQREMIRIDLQRMSRLLERCADLHPLLRLALKEALVGTIPTRSVRELARRMRCHETTLQYHWRSEIRDRSSLTLADFLDWILLLRARVLRELFEKPSGGAPRLGIAPARLERISRRLTGVKLREHDVRGWTATLSSFTRLLDSSEWLPAGSTELESASNHVKVHQFP